mmetsp:Transcript_30720/g.59918  ORF Transcript_30720/g.59918 Transcript_30720/m.59918 type:complete len:228 (+) Transcript_30720:174-857(+)
MPAPPTHRKCMATKTSRQSRLGSSREVQRSHPGGRELQMILSSAGRRQRRQEKTLSACRRKWLLSCQFVCLSFLQQTPLPMGVARSRRQLTAAHVPVLQMDRNGRRQTASGAGSKTFLLTTKAQVKELPFRTQWLLLTLLTCIRLKFLSSKSYLLSCLTMTSRTEHQRSGCSWGWTNMMERERPPDRCTSSTVLGNGLHAAFCRMMLPRGISQLSLRTPSRKSLFRG